MISLHFAFHLAGEQSFSFIFNIPNNM